MNVRLCKFDALVVAVVAAGAIASGWILGDSFLARLNYFAATFRVSPQFLTAAVAPGANSAEFFLEPGIGDVAVGSTLMVSLYVPSSVNITSLKAYLNFDPALLSVISIDTSSSVFDYNAIEKSFDNTTGRIQLQQAEPAPGNQGTGGSSPLAAVITFQVKAAGIAQVTYDTANVLALRGDDTDALPSGGCAKTNHANCAGSYTLFVPDITAPAASISINGGASTATSASVTLTLSCTDASGVKDVRYSNDGVFDTETFEPFAATKAWSISSGDGAKTVSYQCRDILDNVTSASDVITLDTNPPARTLTQPGIQAAGTTSVQLSLTTNESATCRYSSTAGVAYGSMTNTFLAP